jgi:acyl-CoA thioester hydrolase
MAFEISIRPRISETDMMGHINNVAVVAWFEEGRTYLTRQFLPVLEGLPPFILARIEIDYRAQIYFGDEVLIRTGVESIGNSSVAIKQEILQRGRTCAQARSVMVHFDDDTQRSKSLPQHLREGFSAYLLTPG